MPIVRACTCGQLHPQGQRCPDKERRDNQRRADKAKTNGLNTSHWQRIRRVVLARDNHTCQRCGRHRDQLEPNERLTVHLNPALRGDHTRATAADCVTLDSTCHGITDGPRAWHRGAGRSRGAHPTDPPPTSTRTQPQVLRGYP